MDDQPPSTPEQLEEFVRRVDQSPNALTFYISGDQTATIINASFQDSIEYGEAFDYVQKLVEDARDADHDVFLAGQPALTGWVYRLQKQTYNIFTVTILALVIALVLYMRNIAGW